MTRFVGGCASLALLGVRVTGLTILCIRDTMRLALALLHLAVVLMDRGSPQGFVWASRARITSDCADPAVPDASGLTGVSQTAGRLEFEGRPR